MTPQARAERERLAGVCAAHGFRLVSLRRRDGAQYTATISQGDDTWVETAMLGQPLYAAVLDCIDCVQAVARIRGGETTALEEIARLLS